VAEGGTDTICR